MKPIQYKQPVNQAYNYKKSMINIIVLIMVGYEFAKENTWLCFTHLTLRTTGLTYI